MMNNKESLITRIYGVYIVNVKGLAPIILIMMENSFERIQELGGCDRVYDLKGSLYNRKVMEPAKKGSV
jgi:hypothetical protein